MSYSYSLSCSTARIFRLFVAGKSATLSVGICRNIGLQPFCRHITSSSTNRLQSAWSWSLGQCAPYDRISHCQRIKPFGSFALHPVGVKQSRTFRLYQRRFNADGNSQQKSTSSPEIKSGSTSPVNPSNEAAPSFWQKIKQKTQQYGKTFLVIHFGTYAIWFGAFYYLSLTGFDVRWLLQKVNTSEETMQRIESSRFSHAAIAFLLVKVIMPLRYLASIGFTELAVRILRVRGYLPAVTEQDKLRNLVRHEMRSRVERIRQLRALRKQQRARVNGHGHGHISSAGILGGKRTFRSIVGRWKPGRLARILRRMPK